MPAHGRGRDACHRDKHGGGYAPRTVYEKKPLRFVRSGHRENMTRGYFVTRSSQRTIESMTSIDMPQAATKTHHVAHIGVCM